MEVSENMPGKEKTEIQPKIKINFFSFENFKKQLTPQQSLIILGGFILALILIIGVAFFIRNKQPSFPKVTIPPEVVQPLTLSLESPTDGMVVLGDEITVSGETLPNTTVVFYTETDENSIESDANGQFEGTLVLGSGINTLTVTAFAANGEEKTLTLDLVYDDQVKGVKQSPGQVKKQEKQPEKAVIGDVEKVTLDSLTIKEKKEKKKIQTKVDKNTRIFNQNRKTMKLNSLKPKDMAAIIATESGTATDGGKLKKALKIFIRQATTSAQLKRRAVHGVITGINGNQITLAHQIHRERVYNLLVNDQTVFKIKGITDATLAELSVDQRIAAVGSLDADGNLVAKRVHVIPGKATGIFERYPVASPSATITATPSASPSPSATPSVTPILTPTWGVPTPATKTPTPTNGSPTPTTGL